MFKLCAYFNFNSCHLYECMRLCRSTSFFSLVDKIHFVAYVLFSTHTHTRIYNSFDLFRRAFHLILILFKIIFALNYLASFFPSGSILFLVDTSRYYIFFFIFHVRNKIVNFYCFLFQASLFFISWKNSIWMNRESVTERIFCIFACSHGYNTYLSNALSFMQFDCSVIFLCVFLCYKSFRVLINCFNRVTLNHDYSILISFHLCIIEHEILCHCIIVVFRFQKWSFSKYFCFSRFIINVNCRFN